MTEPQTPTLRTLVPMAADGVGPSHTCAWLTSGLADAGSDVEMMATRVRGERTRARLLSTLPGPLARLPYRWVSGPASRMLEAWYLRRLRPGDIAWLWPAVTLATHEAVARRGNPIVLEGINSRMGYAKGILDAAYDAFGAAPAHGITEARVAEEEAKIALAKSIFAPSRLVEEGLRGTPLEDRFLRTSYGVDTKAPRPARARPWPQGDNDPVVYMFCGYACVRKGIHHLLDLWPRMPRNAVLKLVGRIEPVIASRYAALLASDRVELVGFVENTTPHYAEADVFVFPSLEEGDPLVSYEAANFGLPSVTSAIGGGRLGEEHPEARTHVDPADGPAFEAALMALHKDPDRRRAEGARAAEVVTAYDWRLVAAQRQAMFADLMR